MDRCAFDGTSVADSVMSLNCDEWLLRRVSGIPYTAVQHEAIGKDTGHTNAPEPSNAVAPPGESNSPIITSNRAFRMVIQQPVR